jgi:phosphoglycerate dehydrogenase-like enzyme
MHPTRLAVLAGRARPDLHELVESGEAEICYVENGHFPDDLARCEALLVWDFTATDVRAAWAQAANLRWAHVSSAGVDHVLLPEVVESDVVMTNARGVLDETIAEFVLGSVLAMAKDLPGTIRRQDRRIWEHRPTHRVAGRSALVVGPGSVGGRIATMLRAVGMTVDGAGRHSRPATAPFRKVVCSSSLAEIAGAYDLIVVAAALTEQTRGLISADVVRAMRSTAELINVGRGEIVDEHALAAALVEGRLGGAVLDVFETEPLPEASPLWGLPNVIVSPHMAGDFFGWRESLRQVFIENFRRFADGRPLRNVVDKRLGYVGSPPLVGASRKGSRGK